MRSPSQPARSSSAPSDYVNAVKGGRHAGMAARFERGLLPLQVVVPPPSSEATFSWVLMPAGDTFRGTIYSDGSRLDGPDSRIARNGWAFVVTDELGEVIAKAQGLPPDWITGIPGTVAWAILQAAMLAESGCNYRVDCKPCIEAIHRGKKWATAANRRMVHWARMEAEAVW